MRDRVCADLILEPGSGPRGGQGWRLNPELLRKYAKDAAKAAGNALRVVQAKYLRVVYGKVIIAERGGRIE